MRFLPFMMAMVAMLLASLTTPSLAQTTVYGVAIPAKANSGRIDYVTARLIHDIEAADIAKMLQRHDLCNLYLLYVKMEEVQLAGFADRIEYFAVRRVGLKQHIYSELIRRRHEPDYLPALCHFKLEAPNGGTVLQQLNAMNQQAIRRSLILFRPVNGEFPAESVVVSQSPQPRTR